MTSIKLAAAILCLALAVTATSRGETPQRRAAPPVPEQKASASDPAEPPLKVEVSFGSAGRISIRDAIRSTAPPVPRRGVAASAVAVASSARGTTLTLNTPGTSEGTAKLTFKSSAPPMRFTMRLARLQNQDLSGLSLTSGALRLEVGHVGTTATTRYFDARGRAQETDRGAAYTVTARRRAADVEVQLRRGSGAAMGKELTVSWVHAVEFLNDLDVLRGRRR